MRLSTLYVYFKRGWSLWAPAISAFNFLLISYRLLVQQVPFLYNIFPSLTIYSLVAIPAGFVLAVLAGWWDYVHGTAPQESVRIARYSPWHRSLMRSLYYLAENDPDSAKKELERWF